LIIDFLDNLASTHQAPTKATNESSIMPHASEGFNGFFGKVILKVNLTVDVPSRTARAALGIRNASRNAKTRSVKRRLRSKPT